MSLLLHEPERTLNRRQQLGIFRLTHLIVRRELKAREQERDLWLKSQLPAVTSPYLLGRDQWIEWALETLLIWRYNCLIVYGPTGIGKTTFVHRLVSTLIDQRCMREVRWHTQPQPASDLLVSASLSTTTHLATVDTASAPMQHINSSGMVLVLDDADGVINDEVRFTTLRQQLKVDLLIVCACHLDVTYPDIPTLRLPELDKEESFQLLDHQLGINHYGGPEINYETLYRHAGGNPGRLMKALANGSKHYSRFERREAPASLIAAQLPSASPSQSA